MNMANLQDAKGNVVTIEMDCILDLTAFAAFLSASNQANTRETESIDVDLRKTLHIRDSGVAMLQLLRRLTRCTCPIRLVNWDPVVYYRLAACRVETQFDFVPHPHSGRVSSAASA
jgi:hypothetical protein